MMLELKSISVHVEANNTEEALVNNEKDIKSGIAFNQPLRKIIPYSDIADMILVMSVGPVIAANHSTKNAITELSFKTNYPNKIIEVDDGVSTQNSLF